MAQADVERESMEFDVVVVGAGPAGLAAAIKFKQLCDQQGRDYSIAVLEKGAEVGAHILSGVVFDPIALDELLPDWKDDPDCPFDTRVSSDSFKVFGPSGSIAFPLFLFPPFMNNHGKYVGSLSNLCRWLATKAESMGIEVYPGFAVDDLEYDNKGQVVGVITGDFGVGKDGAKKDGYQPGMALRAKYTLIAEGARGSVAKKVIEKFDLDQGKEPQKYGIGLKELWKIDKSKHQPGHITHTMGWPLNLGAEGGGFLYQFGDGYVAVGLVVHLDYKNPYLSPFDEFQRYKHHPEIKEILEDGERIAYGARAITAGGIQSVPKLVFPGGALIGCSAGLVNAARIKGSHNAMTTGMMAAQGAFDALEEDRSCDELSSYQFDFENGRVTNELRLVRNFKPLWKRFGAVFGVGLAGLDMWITTLFGGFSPFGTLKHGKSDAECTEEASKYKAFQYPKPDNKISFDKLSSVFLSNTNHEEDQPAHLTLIDASIPVSVNLPKYAGPAQRYCPAGVYEYVEEAGETKFVINAQNCVHCKTCDIKDPSQNINWTVPEGGGGPVYPNM